LAFGLDVSNVSAALFMATPGSTVAAIGEGDDGEHGRKTTVSAHPEPEPESDSELDEFEIAKRLQLYSLIENVPKKPKSLLHLWCARINIEAKKRNAEITAAQEEAEALQAKASEAYFDKLTKGKEHLFKKKMKQDPGNGRWKLTTIEDPKKVGHKKQKKATTKKEKAKDTTKAMKVAKPKVIKPRVISIPPDNKRKRTPLLPMKSQGTNSICLWSDKL
jgi:hypothetical protein